jgi:hypothetical protein
MTLNRDGPAAVELPSNIRSSFIAIARDFFVDTSRCPCVLVYDEWGSVLIGIRFGESRAR